MSTNRQHRRPVAALAVALAMATLPAAVLLAALAVVLVAWVAVLVHGSRTGRYPATPWMRFESVAGATARRARKLRRRE